MSINPNHFTSEQTSVFETTCSQRPGRIGLWGGGYRPYSFIAHEDDVKPYPESIVKAWRTERYFPVLLWCADKNPQTVSRAIRKYLQDLAPDEPRASIKTLTQKTLLLTKKEA